MKSLGNKFMHLTNYSVNKKNAEYQANADETACQGHKWYLGDVPCHVEAWRSMGFWGLGRCIELVSGGSIKTQRLYKHLVIQNCSVCIQAHSFLI